MSYMRSSGFLIEAFDRRISSTLDDILSIFAVLHRDSSRDMRTNAALLKSLASEGDVTIRRIAGSSSFQVAVSSLLRDLSAYQGANVSSTDIGKRLNSIVSHIKTSFEEELCSVEKSGEITVLPALARPTAFCKTVKYVGVSPSVRARLDAEAFGFSKPSQINETEWRDKLCQCFEQTTLSSVTRELLSLFWQHAVPIVSEDPTTHRSLSINSLPGHIFLSFDQRPYVMLEALVHEADHQVLYRMIEQNEAVVPSGADGVLYRSPWRLDPRPMGGLVFGISAFSRVLSLFSQILTHGCPKRDESLAVRAAIAFLQCQEALITVSENASYGEVANGFLDALDEELRDAESCLSKYPDWQNCLEEASKTVSRRRLDWRNEFGSKDIVSA